MMWCHLLVWLLAYVTLTSAWFSVNEENDTVIQKKDVGVLSLGCMKCLCRVEGCEKNIGQCKMDMGSLSCGPYQIKYKYWLDCGKPGGDWQTCTKQMACSEACVAAYMKRYGRYCTGGREPTCRDYSRMHNGGPTGCRPQRDPATEKRLVHYWSLVQACCQKTRTC